MAANSQELKYVFIFTKLSLRRRDSFCLFLSSPLLPSGVTVLPSVLTFLPLVPLCFRVAPRYARSLCAWLFFIFFSLCTPHHVAVIAIWTASLANWHEPLGSARSLCCKKHLVSVSQPAGAQHLVVMDLDMWLGTMLRTEGSGEEEEGGVRAGVRERKHSLQLSMKHICQMHDIQTDGESLTLCCKHGALLKFLCLLIYLAASPILCVTLITSCANPLPGALMSNIWSID